MRDFAKALVGNRALLIGMALLTLGAGLQATLLGVRATLEGLSTFATGGVLASYYVGFVIGSMAAEPPTAEDVKLAQDNEVNSFVFRFESASQIVGQQLGYALDGLPPNWFDLYLRGIQAVTAAQVREVTAKHLHPDRLVTVIVGKSSAFDRPLAEVGEVTVLPVDGIRR